MQLCKNYILINLIISAFLYAFNKMIDTLMNTKKVKYLRNIFVYVYIYRYIYTKVKQNVTEHNWLLDNKETTRSSTAVSHFPLQSSDPMVYASSEIINS